MVAENLEEVIKTQVNKTLEESDQNPTEKLARLPEFIETDSLGETVEKLVILHIRTWMLEDAIQAAISDKEVADLKRKIDICFKIKRPKFFGFCDWRQICQCIIRKVKRTQRRQFFQWSNICQLIRG